MAAQSARAPKPNLERNLLWTAIALVAVGVVAVLDASFAREIENAAHGRNGFYFLIRQSMFAGIGLCALWAGRLVPLTWLQRNSRPLFIATMIMLLACFIPFIRVPQSGVHRWIGFGPVVIQPSELAKITLVLFLAARLAKLDQRRQLFKRDVAPLVFPIAAAFILTEFEPDLGTALIIGVSGFCLLFLGGVRPRYLGAIAAVSVLGIAVMVFMPSRHGYRGGRISEWRQMHSANPDVNTQTYAGMRAVGAGQVVGVGLTQGKEKFSLPAAHTDYIFATVGEEVGLVGSLVLVGLLWVLTVQAMRTAEQCSDRFASLSAAGIGITIGSQSLLNIGVVTGLLPNTGVPLPFISYGGSSLVFLLLGVGILLNIARQAEAVPKK